jgi:hypothetical protein
MYSSTTFAVAADSGSSRVMRLLPDLRNAGNSAAGVAGRLFRVLVLIVFPPMPAGRASALAPFTLTIGRFPSTASIAVAWKLQPPSGRW